MSDVGNEEIDNVKWVKGLLLVVLVAASPLAFAAAPSLKASRSVTVHAAPEQVWEKVGDFDGAARWQPSVAKAEIVAGTNNQIGAERVLTLRDGGTVREKLLGFDPKHHRFRYTMIEGVLPVSGYVSVLSIKGAGPNRSKVTWSGTFKRKNTGASPAANENDAAATKAVGAVYRAGLDNLKKIIDAK